MSHIELSIDPMPHAPAAQIGYSLLTARITAQVSLKTATGWTAYRRGIVDTGAAVSLFPARVWHDAKHQAIGRVRIGGVVPRDECRMSAQFAKLSCALSDGSQTIGPLTIHAYLAKSDEVPLLLGVADLIERGELLVAIGQNQASFSLPAGAPRK